MIGVFNLLHGILQFGTDVTVQIGKETTLEKGGKLNNTKR